MYDGFGRPTSIALGGIAHTYRYDALGRRVFASNPDSVSGRSYQYDILDRATKITHPDNTSQTLSYGAGTQTVTDERGHATTYRYRAYGDPDRQFLMGIGAPEPSASITIARNSVDLVEAVSQNGLTRTYGYNGNYYLTSVGDPETGATSYGRDAAGNMTSRTVGSAGTTSYTYDNQNRLYGVDYPGNTPSTTRAYSRTNKLKSVSSSAAARSFDYDNNDNLTAETLVVDGYVLRAGYGYNANDQLSSITYPHSSRTVNYSPDVLGRPTQVSVYVTGVDYWPSGQIKRIVHGNGVVAEYGQNARLWPSSFQTSRSATGFYVNSQYTYDGAGNLTQIGDATDAGYRRSLGYDAINRLTDVAGPWGSGSIAYTGTGNILSQVFGANRTDYTYDSQNRLTRIAGAQTASFGYDGYGDVISDSRYAYEYDGVPNLRCVSASAPCGGAASKIEYAYDGLDRRVSVARAGVKTYEFHDSGGNLLTELTPGQGNRLVEYYYLGSKRVAQRVSIQPPLTVLKNGAGSGTVTSAPAGINCGATCSAAFAAGTGVTLTATPAVGSVFVGWGGACSGVGSCQVTMTDARSVTATFNPVTPIASIITHYYQAILGRMPDPGGLSYWQAEIVRVQGLGIDAQEAFRVMAGQFFISPEYLGKNTGDAQYLADLYATFFNRAPDSGGLSFWLGQMAAGMPRSNVLYGFLFSVEFGGYLQGLLGNTSSRQEVYAVVDFYRGLLGRLPDSSGFNYWLGRLRAAQCQGAAAVNAEVNTLSGLILSGGEYVGRQRSNRDFVADLFYTFMRRGSDLSSLNYWAGYLDSNPQNRDTVRWFFWQSAEYQGRVQQIVAQGCLQ